MEVFNKLKSAVTNVLPGIPLSKDFDIHQQVASGGPGLLWKIHGGLKKTTKQEVSIFVFDKKSIEKYSRKDKELILETLKKGVSQLTRLRHPNILSVLHPLEESRETFAFATEPVLASLSNILGCHDNIAAVPAELQNHQLYEVEIKYGLLQVTEALAFLHNDVKMMHHNICPDTVIVNRNGSWKLAGFDFCVQNANPPEQAPLYPFKEWDPTTPYVIQPSLDYLAPEYALTLMCGPASDMYSLGVLIYSVFNKGKTIFACQNELSAFRRNAEELRKLRASILGSLADGVRDYVKLLLNTEPSVRPDPEQLSKINFFEDVGSMTLQYMDTLFQRDNLQKSNFFKGLPKIIVKLPKRVNHQRILPALFKECVNPDMVPFVLPGVLQIAEQASDKEFKKDILPELIPLFKLQEPIQVLLLFMQNMNLLLSKTPSQDIKAHVLPMIFRALEADNPQVQELCLNIIPSFAELIEYQSLKNSIIPRIKKLCLSTSILSIRVNCLLCVGKLLENMDKWYVLDEILPLLPQIPSREPAVLMTMLGIYKVTMTHSKLGITKDMIAGKVLPFLLPLCIENNLNLDQFNAFIALVKDMIKKVETEHRGKLQQIEQMKQEQKSIEITQVTGNSKDNLIPEIPSEQQSSMMGKFLSGFGFGSSYSTDKKNPAESSNPVQQSAPSRSQPSTDSHLPNQPAKVNLTLEEKQKLAKQQEQQQVYKSQKPIQPAGSMSMNRQASPVSKPSNTQVKDLTSSLMNSNMMGLQGSTQISSMNKSVNNCAMSPSLSSNSSSMGMGSFGSAASTNTFGMQGSPAASHMSKGPSSSPQLKSPSNQPVDLSSFDSLLPSSGKKNMPMNAMSQNKPVNTGVFSNSSGGSGMGMGMGTNSSMNMQGQPNMMSSQGTFGNQSMMGMQGMGGNMGFGNRASNMTVNTGFTSTQTNYSGFSQTHNSSSFPQGNSPGYSQMNVSRPQMTGQTGMPMMNTGLMMSGSSASPQHPQNKSQPNNELNDLFG